MVSLSSRRNSNANCPTRPSQNEYRKRVPVRLHQISVIAKLRRVIGVAADVSPLHLKIARNIMSRFTSAATILEMGSTAAPGCRVRRPRRTHFCPPDVSSEGAGNCARDGRAPPIVHPKLAFGRTAGTLLGSATVPVAVVGVRRKPFPKLNGSTGARIVPIRSASPNQPASKLSSRLSSFHPLRVGTTRAPSSRHRERIISHFVAG